jgi:radical SAM protein with 4Fe4S-binding SPASM domain
MTSVHRDAGSFTGAGEHTTAAAMGKSYAAEFTPSSEPNKSPARECDGDLSSGAYARQSKLLSDEPATADTLTLAYRHPLEWWAARRPMRWLLRGLTKTRRDGQTTLERILASYGDPEASRGSRLKYWPIHKFIDRMRGQTDIATFREKLVENRPTIRGVIIAARSIAANGLTVPQRFSMPLFSVWNFTNRCNLTCKHCYQDSTHAALDNELTLEEKLGVIDQMGEAYMPMIAFSGGEPTIHPDLIPCVERAASYGMHISIATNGTTMTPKLAGELAAAGARYIEISLDSVDPARHDAFRGVEGMWEKSVAGARTVVATEGLRLGVAMCVHQENLDEVEAMIDFAENDLGASCFAHFNFIPVGRGLKMVSGDLTPAQREKLLAMLNAKMQEDGIGVISTAPQLGRVCLAGAALDDGLVSCSHAGAGSGVKARVIAKYLGGCGAGRTYVCIEPDGNVTPCVYLPHRVMGNLREASLETIFHESHFTELLNDRDHRLGHCEVCAFKSYCGGCRARADAYHGQLHGGDPGCVFNSKHWDKLVSDGVAVEGDDDATPPRRHGFG